MKYAGSHVFPMRCMKIHIVIWFRSIPAFWIGHLMMVRLSAEAQLCHTCSSWSTKDNTKSNRKGWEAPDLWLNFCSKLPTDPFLITLPPPTALSCTKFFGDSALSDLPLVNPPFFFSIPLRVLKTKVSRSISGSPRCRAALNLLQYFCSEHAVAMPCLGGISSDELSFSRAGCMDNSSF